MKRLWWLAGVIGVAGLALWAITLARVSWFRLAQPVAFGEPVAVLAGLPVGQTFISHHPGLTAITLEPVTPWPPDDQPVTLRLSEVAGGRVLIEQTLPFGAWHNGRFLFPPLDDSAGRLLRFEIESNGAPLWLNRFPADVHNEGEQQVCVPNQGDGRQGPDGAVTPLACTATEGDLTFWVDYNGRVGPTLTSLIGQLTAGRPGWAGQAGLYGLLAGAYGLAVLAVAVSLFRRAQALKMTTLPPPVATAVDVASKPTPIRSAIRKVIVQIPCLNEAETLPVTLAAIPRQIEGVGRVEVLVIDDGSTDGTAEVALAHGADHLVRHPARRGLAVAFESGVQASLAAGAEVIVNTDGDNQYPGDQIPLLLGPLLAGQADVVVGDRKPGDNREFTWSKRVLQRLGSWVVAQAAGAPVPDATSGFRAYTRDAALRLYQFTRYTYTLETLIQAGKKGLRVAHVDITTNPVARPSRLMRSQWEYVKRSAATIVRLYAIYEPLRTFGLISMPFILVGLALIGRFLFLYAFGFLAEGVARLVQSLLIGGTSLVVGILILMFGLLADLIAANRRLSEEALYRLRRMELDRARDPD